MELSFEEQLKLTNSKEHLKVVQSNIRIANEQLSDILNKVSKAKEELISSKEELEIISLSSKDILNKIEEKQNELNNKELSLFKRESLIDDKEKVSQENIKVLDNTIKELKSSIVILKNNYNKQKELLDNDIVVLNNKIKELKLVLNELTEDYKSKSSLKRNIEDEINILITTKERLEKELDSFKKQSSIEMDKISLLINEEKGKITAPLDLLRREQNKLEKEKINLAIIKNRLTQQFKNQNPNKLLPIELQNKDNGENK